MLKIVIPNPKIKYELYLNGDDLKSYPRWWGRGWILTTYLQCSVF